jgi:plasmid stabilization system protein ParE
MGEATFRVVFTHRAHADLDQLSEYWTGRGEAWRAEKYHRDLVHRAEAELSDAASARRGRRAKSPTWLGAREILAFGVYRIIYRIDESEGVVNILRFWHAHRDDTSADA